MSMCLFCAVVLTAQREVIHPVQESLLQFPENTLQEKIFLHTDKTFYLAGELIWFKMYCVESSSHKLLDVSKVAYADVLDKNNKPVLQVKISLDKGEGNGSFYLPVSLGSGMYTIRAYTNWMKNFGPACFFEKAITIVNSLKRIQSLQNDSASYQADFFPEGGYLVAGLQSRVAFKVADQSGKGMEYEGMIVDENNTTVVRFQPYRFGMGSFSFIPKPGHTYKAVVSLYGNWSITKELPVALESGYVMNVTNVSDSLIKVIVQTNVKTSGTEAGVFFAASNRNKVIILKSAAIRNDSATFLINKNDLKQGITQFTVYSSSRKPVCERLYFRRPLQEMSIEAQSDAITYEARKKVNILVATKESAAKPVPASLSMSVYLIDSLQLQDQADIANYLWMTSELKGTIESPQYYFSHDDKQAEDNLMLTHGWRRFKGQGIPAGERPAFSYTPEYYGHIISGKVLNVSTGKPVKDIQTYLSVPGTYTKFYTQKSGDSGEVKFDVKGYYGAGEVVIQTHEQDQAAYRIEVASPYAEELSHTDLPLFTLDEKQQYQLTRRSVSMQVQHAYAEDSISKFALPRIDSLPFYGKPDHQYLLDNYTRFVTMEEVLREYVREINVRNHSSGLEMIMLDEPHREFFSGNLLVLLDGVPVFDQSKIFSYDPLKVRKLDIITTQYFLGYYAYNGIASFTTYKGELEGFQLDPKAVVLDYDGLQLQREFYSPQYATEKQLSGRTPDFRSVLQWSPDIKTDELGKKQLSFYTSDTKGKYLVVLQGIDAEGRVGSISFPIEVK